ncbi:helix-turn-helix domain-containing protein [Auritidibacter ignavus]|uniref:Helix-turn-helix domain-containing protein n=1 Tax=Auritidibacter ignavus TaxID=678932 RepID=A0AAJ6AJJ9_9MICC|nr:helix-turn-helix domain-containing protein [Auritidibacter ignavus]WGH93862.1 helix-turn-helix domain-containing protein [Auritidibacter ignavus]
MTEPRKLQGVDYFQWLRIMRRIQFGKNTGDTSAPMLKNIALILGSYADVKTGERAYPGITRLAHVVATTPRTVIRALGHLEKLGLIEAVRRGSTYGVYGQGKGTNYRLTIPSDLEEHVTLLPLHITEQDPIGTHPHPRTTPTTQITEATTHIKTIADQLQHLAQTLNNITQQDQNNS